MRKVQRPRYDRYWLAVDTAGRLVLNTCIPTGLFTRNSISRTPVQFSSCRFSSYARNDFWSLVRLSPRQCQGLGWFQHKNFRSADFWCCLCVHQCSRICILGFFYQISKSDFFVFTAWWYASAVLAMALCPSVCPSVTSRYFTKTAKRRITQTTPHDSLGTLVLWRRRSPRNSTGVTPYGGIKWRWGGSKSATFAKNRLFLENGKR